MLVDIIFNALFVFSLMMTCFRKYNEFYVLDSKLRRFHGKRESFPFHKKVIDKKGIVIFIRLEILEKYEMLIEHDQMIVFIVILYRFKGLPTLTCREKVISNKSSLFNHFNSWKCDLSSSYWLDGLIEKSIQSQIKEFLGCLTYGNTLRVDSFRGRKFQGYKKGLTFGNGGVKKFSRFKL